MTDTRETSEDDKTRPQDAESPATPTDAHGGNDAEDAGPKEVGGPKGPEPTRFGDWERNGIASDF